MIVPVKKLTVITLVNNEKSLLEFLGKMAVVQLKRLDDNEFVSFEGISKEETRIYENTCEKLHLIKEKLSRPIKELKFEVSSLNESKKEIKDFQIPLEELQEKVNSFDIEVDSALKKLEMLKNALPLIQILENQGIKPNELGDFENIFVKAGVVKPHFIKFLRLRMKSHESITLKEATISNEETLIYIAGVLELKPWIQKILASIGFKEIILSKELVDGKNIDLPWIDSEIKKIESKIKKYWEVINSLMDVSKCSRNISDAKSYLLRSKTMVMLQGWVPEDRIKTLNMSFDGLNKEIGGTIYYSYEDPLPDESMPTVMKNPKIFRAYEVLTRQFGCPDARESDPTIISTILWIMMFGLMFPDLGQGLVIFSLGMIFTYGLKKHMMGMNFIKLGQLMIGLGFSASIFGLLTGEFFLTEFHPLWPGLLPAWVGNPTNVIWIIKIAVFFGIAQIITGLILNIKNHFKEGNKLEALAGDRGLAGLVTFIGVVIISSEFLGVSLLPGISFPELKMNVISHWTIAIPIAGLVAIAFKTILGGEGVSMTFGVIMETITSCMANVLSYARIAGFCIAHATFSLIVVKLFHANPMLGIGLGLIFLNLFSLSLEMMVVMIQSLRLLYYEFSTKFFKGTGSPYTPYSLNITQKI